MELMHGGNSERKNQYHKTMKCVCKGALEQLEEEMKILTENQRQLKAISHGLAKTMLGDEYDDDSGNDD
jgi:hypothetical protein